MPQPNSLKYLNDLVVIGQLGSPYGVRGWLHLQSFMLQPADLLKFSKWFLTKNRTDNIYHKITINIDLVLDKNILIKTVENIRAHGKDFVVKLKDIELREQAALLTNQYISVLRANFPELTTTEEFYWVDLIDAEVFNLTTNMSLGRVTDILATGANDVLVIENNKYLIPCVLDEYIKQIDLTAKKIIVTWENDAL